MGEQISAAQRQRLVQTASRKVVHHAAAPLHGLATSEQTRRPYILRRMLRHTTVAKLQKLILASRQHYKQYMPQPWFKIRAIPQEQYKSSSWRAGNRNNMVYSPSKAVPADAQIKAQSRSGSNTLSASGRTNLSHAAPETCPDSFAEGRAPCRGAAAWPGHQRTT